MPAYVPSRNAANSHQPDITILPLPCARPAIVRLRDPAVVRTRVVLLSCLSATKKKKSPVAAGPLQDIGTVEGLSQTYNTLCIRHHFPTKDSGGTGGAQGRRRQIFERCRHVAGARPVARLR